MNTWMHRALGVLGTAAATVAVVTAAAGAADGQAPPDAFERAVARAQDAPLAVDRTGAQAIAANPVTPGALQSAYTNALEHGVALGPDDRRDARGPGVFSAGSPAGDVAVSKQGFAWGDALKGAAAMLALVVVGALAAMAVLQRRRPALS